jgi:hypothetical protein
MDVSCGSVSSCVVADWGGFVIAYRDGRWMQPRQVDPKAIISTVSCADEQLCVVVGWDDRVVTYSA